ncbi:Methyltransferase type 11 [Pyrenophora seminiperda CCB06]|uniref:Methyltransferase type 11 n=1 Tax=Pyrenophora seminiperda CCB06 TaxID=1302712 RepID=A0A3M7LVS9_9PLEO|nr:Methyltransferase type 11 [Pyrenophora seminiperda CCB06]
MEAFAPGTASSLHVDSLSHCSESSCYSDPPSIERWLSTMFAAHGQSAKRPAGAVSQQSRTTRHADKPESTAEAETRAMGSNKRRNIRVTRSVSRHNEIVERVAALDIVEGGGDDRVAELPPSDPPMTTGSHADLVGLPQTTSAHRWISADAQSQSSSSTRTPTDTESVTTKTTVTSSLSRIARARSKSPVKSMVDLSLLDRKVRRVHLEGKEFPEAIRHLVRGVEHIRRGKGIIPQEIRSDFEQRVEAEDWWWSPTPSALLSKGKLLVELEVMEEIRDKTRKLHDSDAAEPQWNSDVHFMMLRQVCIHLPGIQQQNITSARPNPHLVPKTGFNDTESKLVDYALLCDESLIPSRLVEQVLADSRNEIDSINHTSASVQSLRQDPIAVSIETKTPNGSESAALTQLSLWAATHFNRLRTLLPPSKRDVVSMPLPLIMAVGGRYSLFFAIDGAIEEGISITGGETAYGDCATLEGCYQVLAGLLLVGTWVKEVWVPWFVRECLATRTEC